MNALTILARTPATVLTQLVVTTVSASRDLRGRTVRMTLMNAREVTLVKMVERVRTK